MEDTHGNGSIFGGGLEPPKYVLVSDFLNPHALVREGQGLAIGVKRLASEAKMLLQFPNEEIASRWKKLDLKAKEIYKAKFRLGRFIEGSPLGNTVIGTDLLLVLEAAEKLISFRDLEKQRKIADGNGLLSPIKDFFDWTQFAISGETVLRIGEVSIKDVMENEDLSPAAFFKQQIEAQIIKTKLTHQSILEQNQHIPLTLQFPNVTKGKIQGAAGEITALWIMRSFQNIFDIIVDKLDLPTRSERELASTAQTMLERVRVLKNVIYETILNPRSHGFEELKRIASEYLFQPDQEISIRAIYSLGIGGIEKESNVPDAYRRARKLGQGSDQNADFYRGLAQSIITFVEVSPLKQEFLTKDDTVIFLDESKPLPQEPIPTIEDLRKINGQIFLKAQEKEYAVNPQGINWTNLIPPQEVKVQFSEGGPRKFSIALRYKNQEGETSNINFVFNTKREEFDWPFLEDPNDPDMKEMKDTLMLTAKEILLNVRKQAEHKSQAKQKAKEAKIQPLSTTNFNGRKPKFEIPYVPREKEKKPEKERLLTPIQEALSEAIFDPTAKKAKKHITLPSNKDNMQKIMEGIDERYQVFILQKIQDFNERGAGNFKALSEYITQEGKKVYELRTGNKYRVLLTEVSRTNGNGNNKTNEFEIYKIGNRGEIFKIRQKT